MIVNVKFGMVDSEGGARLQTPPRGCDDPTFYVHFGTFGRLSLDALGSVLPYASRHSEDLWVIDLTALGRAVGAEWPKTWRGRMQMRSSGVQHGTTNTYGVRADISQITLYGEHAVMEGAVNSKIFLSHKGVDKGLVWRYFNTLRLLGFDPWLDEDALLAGAELERGLLQGFATSCAAVFFVTPSFRDESYLATEVDYAIAEKRNKGDRFQIITLVLTDAAGAQGSVPDILRRYVWKEPHNDLDALQSIIRALPISVGPVSWRFTKGDPADFTWPGWTVSG